MCTSDISDKLVLVCMLHIWPARSRTPVRIPIVQMRPPMGAGFAAREFAIRFICDEGTNSQE
jgi:hypothetical protein